MNAERENEELHAELRALQAKLTATETELDTVRLERDQAYHAIVDAWLDYDFVTLNNHEHCDTLADALKHRKDFGR